MPQREKRQQSNARKAGSLPHGNGGGAATNAGVDFQQRVSALMLVLMECEVPVRDVLSINVGRIRAVRFEATEPIDDLALETDEAGAVVYLQIKRSITLGRNSHSELAKTLRQFVTQFLKGSSSDSYVLATSSKASSVLVNVIGKWCDLVRLDARAIDIPRTLSKIERTAIATFKSMLHAQFERVIHRSPTELEIVNIVSRTHLVCIDIEIGLPSEQAALCLLTARFAIPPDAIWSMLITSSLSYAKQRAVVTVDAQGDRLSKYRKTSTTNEIMKNDNFFKFIEEYPGSLPSGRDVVLIDWKDNACGAIMDFRRFDDACNGKLSFRNGQLFCEAFPDGVGVLLRAATVSGLLRLIETHPLPSHMREVVFVESSFETDPEILDCARAHRELYHKILKDRGDAVMQCLHCGKVALAGLVQLVELDADGFESTVGCVHDRCLVETDRVIGHIKRPEQDKGNEFINFDIALWARLLRNSGNMFNSIAKTSLKAGVITIGWNPENGGSSEMGSWCIECKLANGERRCMTTRNALHRFSNAAIESKLTFVRQRLEQSKAAGDPHGFCIPSWTWCQESQFALARCEGDVFVKVVSIEAVKYDERLRAKYDSGKCFYAPLAMVVSTETGESWRLDNHTVYFSNPLSAGSIIQTWKDSGIAAGEYELHIIKTDSEFDAMMHKHPFALVDPVVDKKGVPVSGFSIYSMETIGAMLGERGSNLLH